MIKSQNAHTFDTLTSTKEVVKIKISWLNYTLYNNYVDLKDLLSIKLPLELSLFEIQNKDVFINVPVEYNALLNGSPTNSKFELKFMDKALLSKDNISIELHKTYPEEKHSIPMFENPSKFIYMFMSGVVHFSLIAILAFFMPPLGLDNEDGISKDNLFLMQQYLSAAAEREQETKPTEEVATDKADDKEGGTGTRAAGEEGSMGNPNSRDSGKRYAIAGPKDNIDVHIARMNALRDASTFGMIGLLNTNSGGDPNAPIAPWGRDESLGNDPLSARGNMWGNEIGESFGSNGLGLSGIGEGGNGRGEGIGVGSIGTIGHGAGEGKLQGFGNGHGILQSGHKVKVPTVRFGTTVSTGRLPADTIQRIVRQNYGRFRNCYEPALRNNPNLTGRVSVRFIIDRTGSVSNVGNGGSDLPDPNVVQCIIRSFYGLSFPEPDGGIVSVIYPIVLIPQ